MWGKSRRAIKIGVVVGARPNFIKLAPLVRRATEFPKYQLKIIHTGQHFDSQMSGVFFEQLGIPAPDINLQVRGERHTEKIGQMFDSLKEVFKHHKFNVAIVFGDVNSTLAGALAASKYNIPLVHIEAGLRSHDRRMPEEINRVIVDHLSSLLFASEASAVENLKREGVKDKKIKLVGNIMIESLELFQAEIDRSSVLTQLKLKSRGYVVVTIHRQENTDNVIALREILTVINQLSKKFNLVFVLHPGTRIKIEQFKLKQLLDGVRVIEPVGYFDFVKLVKESGGVVTDSGGIQEETSHLGVPCVTLRDNTERPITLERGTNRLFSVGQGNFEMIAQHLKAVHSPGQIPLWDNSVTKRIFNELNLWTR